MPNWPDTEPTLVRRLADASDDAAWNRFDELYRPMIYRFARAEGLQHDDAETLVAEVMGRVFRAASRWSGGETREPVSGLQQRPEKFRAWLRRVAKNALLNLVTRQLKQRGTGGTSHQLSLLGRPQADESARRRWETEHRQHLFRLAARDVQAGVDELQWTIFWQTHVDNAPIVEVASQTHHSIGAIYAIRSRILKRLRMTVERIHSLSEEAMERP